MKVYMITDEEMRGLFDQLELSSMRQQNVTHADPKNQVVQDIHRAFHFVATRWAGAMGYSGQR